MKQGLVIPALAKHLSAVQYAMSEDATRPHMHCVLIENGMLVATDGHQLACIRVLEHSAKHPPILLHYADVKSIIKSARGNLSGEVLIRESLAPRGVKIHTMISGKNAQGSQWTIDCDKLDPPNAFPPWQHVMVKLENQKPMSMVCVNLEYVAKVGKGFSVYDVVTKNRRGKNERRKCIPRMHFFGGDLDPVLFTHPDTSLQWIVMPVRI
jgi:hypothetical protein